MPPAIPAVDPNDHSVSAVQLPNTASTTRAEKRIDIDAQEARQDPVLASFAMLAQILDKPVHVPALRVGFAVDEHGHIPLASYPDLGAKHGLITTWSKMRPSQLPSYVLPAIIPLSDGRACVLIAVKGQEAQLHMPESGWQTLTMPLSELDAQAHGEVMVVKPAIKHGEFQLTPFKGQAFSWFWSALWRFRHFYYDAVVATVVANILTLAAIFFTMNVYNRVVPTQAYTSLWTLAIGTFIAIGLEFVMRWLKARLVDLGGKRADLAINATLLREIMSIRLEHRPQSIGIFASSMRDFEALRDFFSSASLVTLADLPFLFLFLALIWVVGGPIVWIPVIIIPILIIIGLAAQKPLMKAIRENMRESGERQTVLVESLLNLEMLKAHNAEGYLQRRWEQANLAAADSYKKTRALTNTIMGVTTTAQQLVTVGMVTLGVYLIHDNQLSLGGLIACVMLSGRAIAPLGSIMSLAARYQQAVTALETLDGLMKRPRDRSADRNYVVPEQIQGALAVEELEFAYPGEHKIPVIRKLTFELAAGEQVAVLGRVGSGKSTMLRLIAGLYQPGGGSVRVDGVDVQQLDPAELRSRIGYVGQDAQLFMGTLRENLVLSDTWISDTQIVDVLQKVDLYHLVSSHPRGLDMLLTEAGGGLSGGQRQLLAIARMMLRNPAFVFMDEPTSAMDQNTESRIIKVLSEWLKGRTVVLSTHRPQLLVWVNRIMVMDKGALIAQGPRDEMLKKLARGVNRPVRAVDPEDPAQPTSESPQVA